MNKKNIRDINLKGKKVFLRVDYNVPMDENQNITNTKRIDATLPTLNYLLEQGAAIKIDGTVYKILKVSRPVLGLTRIELEGYSG